MLPASPPGQVSGGGAPERYFAGEGYLVPNCNSAYNTPCSVANAYKVVEKTRHDLTGTSTPTDARTLLKQINTGAYENGAEGTGFGPLIINRSNGMVLADANGPGLVNLTLEQILALDSSGCARDSFVETSCYQAATVIMQADLLQRLQEAASSDGWTAFLWPEEMEKSGILRPRNGPGRPEQKVGFLQEALTPLGMLLVVSTFSDNPLWIDAEILPCSDKSSRLCATEASRLLVGNVLTKMMTVAAPWQLERLFHGISFNAEDYSLGDFYTFVYRFGDFGEPGKHGECVAHGRNFKFVGKNLSEILSFVGNEAVNGLEVHNLFATSASHGGGWVEYAWKNNALQEPYLKTAYITGTQRFGVKYYVGVGFNSAAPKPMDGPRCEKCRALFSYPCAMNNVLAIVGRVYAMLLTDIPESEAWALLTDIPQSNGYDPGFYAFVLDVNGTCVAHGADSKYVGMQIEEMLANTTEDASALHQRFIKAATLGGRWVGYEFREPGADDGVISPKASYVKPVTKYGRHFYVAVGMYRNQWHPEDADGCSADFSATCSEDNVLAIVGAVASAISMAQTQDALKAIFNEIANGTNSGGSVQFERPGGFYVEVYNSDAVCEAHGTHPISGRGARFGMFRSRRSGELGWLEATMFRNGTRQHWRLFTQKVEYAPLDSKRKQWYFVASGYQVGSRPTPCKFGCPKHSTCSQSDNHCLCDAGTKVVFSASMSNCTEIAEDMIMQCLPCPPDHTSHPGSAECTKCPPGQSAVEGSSYCSDNSGTNVVLIVICILTTLFLGIVLLLSVTGCRVGIRRYLKQRLSARHDRPDKPDSPTGQWVQKWIGPVKFNCLMHNRDVANQDEGQHWVINATPFNVTLEIEGSSRGTQRQSSPSDNTNLITFPSQESTKIKNLTLGANSFQKAPFQIPRCMDLRLAACETPQAEDWGASTFASSWADLAEQTFTVECDDWRLYPGDTDRKNFRVRSREGHFSQLEYDNEVVRIPLGHGRRGELKLTFSHDRISKRPNHDHDGYFSVSDLRRESEKKTRLLIAWSPPHTLRGMRFTDLSDFFQRVTDHSDVWACRDEQGMEVKKQKGSEERNMYDACDHYLITEVATKDASYAELHSNLGQPNVFISHVWGTAVGITETCLDKIAERSRRAGRTASEDRFWFCVCCNNQSRVSEELGASVSASAFATVLQSEPCQLFCIVQPFKALERKWCNYELSFASSLDKRVLMVLPDGIIQEGDVAPRILCALAEQVACFYCKDAACHSEKDSAYIDNAIQEMGGYDKLDDLLKDIVTYAVHEAVHWAHAAENRAISLQNSGMFKSAAQVSTGITRLATGIKGHDPQEPQTDFGVMPLHVPVSNPDV